VFSPEVEKQPFSLTFRKLMPVTINIIKAYILVVFYTGTLDKITENVSK
jgi:hypothetical protein